ncbi:MAG: transcription elongation factor GreA [Flavobacteriales bacterium]|jgi:transcription elongation factor GreA|nr:transcription elongation factor GreA [Flavobacteriales bacterium]MBK6892494.1 transcription elongation factor GreA [Flavobacteriales bacterium]MBK7246632.1 transcription elongation factor GreA [Flavobacteriales bacterium]MBK7286827.1 transcription elongation factor GreA [Flavobacteriales bacterium]MBK9061062.1 transcription elongation factor GreA [Flavobacteriales bacterium]
MSTIAYYTEEGLKKLQDELHHLKTVDRPHISKQIAEARDKGDLSENAEYHAAKEDQGLLEARIAKMEEVLASARVIDPDQVDTDKVYIHCTVKVRQSGGKMERSFTLVAESEADLKTGKISVNSPIGKGLLGKKVGEEAEIVTPNGVTKFEVMEISR